MTNKSPHGRTLRTNGLQVYASPSSDIVEHPNRTIDVPHCHCDMALSQLALIHLLWLVSWSHGVIFIIAGVVGVP